MTNSPIIKYNPQTNFKELTNLLIFLIRFIMNQIMIYQFYH